MYLRACGKNRKDVISRDYATTLERFGGWWYGPILIDLKGS